MPVAHLLCVRPSSFESCLLFTEFDTTGRPVLDENVAVVNPDLESANGVPNSSSRQSPVMPSKSAGGRFDVLNSSRIHVEGFQSIEKKRTVRRAMEAEEDFVKETDDAGSLHETETEAGTEMNDVDEGSGTVPEMELEGTATLDFTSTDSNIPLSEGESYDNEATLPKTTTTTSPDDTDAWSLISFFPFEEGMLETEPPVTKDDELREHTEDPTIGKDDIEHNTADETNSVQETVEDDFDLSSLNLAGIGESRADVAMQEEMLVKGLLRSCRSISHLLHK